MIKKIKIIIITFVAIIIIAGIGYGNNRFFDMREVPLSSEEKVSEIEVSNSDAIKEVEEQVVVRQESNEIATSKEITDWKTYRNEEYGFEIEYPEYLDESYPQIQRFSYGQLTMITFADIREEYLFIPFVIQLLPQSLSSSTQVELTRRKHEVKKSEIVIAGIKAMQYKVNPLASEVDDYWKIYIESYDKNTDIVLTFQGDFANNLYKQILPTFKFIE